MKNIIKEIFKIKECEVEELEKGYFIKNKNNTSFYFSAFFEEAEVDNLIRVIEETQESFYEFLTTKHNSKGIIKNTNFLIIIKGDLYSQQIEKMIFDLEEDEYFFRKYVLVYSKKEYESLLQELKTKNIKSLLQESLTNKKKFQNFKLNKIHDWLSLILKMYIKIPELNYFDNKNEKAGLSNLTEQINEDLPKLDLMKIKKFCLEISENIEDEELKNLMLNYEVEYAEN